jgi:hypothetical protein
MNESRIGWIYREKFGEHHLFIVVAEREAYKGWLLAPMNHEHINVIQPEWALDETYERLA